MACNFAIDRRCNASKSEKCIIEDSNVLPFCRLRLKLLRDDEERQKSLNSLLEQAGKLNW